MAPKFTLHDKTETKAIFQKEKSDMHLKSSFIKKFKIKKQFFAYFSSEIKTY